MENSHLDFFFVFNNKNDDDLFLMMIHFLFISLKKNIFENDSEYEKVNDEQQPIE